MTIEHSTCLLLTAAGLDALTRHTIESIQAWVTFGSEADSHELAGVMEELAHQHPEVVQRVSRQLRREQDAWKRRHP